MRKFIQSKISSTNKSLDEISKFKQFKKDLRGNVAMMTAIAMIPIGAGVAAAIEINRAQTARAHLQTAMDAAVLAGAREFISTGHLAEKARVARMVKVAEDFFNAQVTTGATVLTNITPTFVLNADRELEGRVTADMHTFMGALVNRQIMVLGNQSTAKVGSDRILEVALVLDNTASMFEKGRFSDMREAAKNFVNIMFDGALAPGDVRIAVIPYAGLVNIKSEKPDKAALIRPTPTTPPIWGTGGAAPAGVDRIANLTWHENDTPLDQTTLDKMFRPTGWRGCVRSARNEWDMFVNPTDNKPTPERWRVGLVETELSARTKKTFQYVERCEVKPWGWRTITPQPPRSPRPPKPPPAPKPPAPAITGEVQDNIRLTATEGTPPVSRTPVQKALMEEHESTDIAINDTTSEFSDLLTRSWDRIRSEIEFPEPNPGAIENTGPREDCENQPVPPGHPGFRYKIGNSWVDSTIHYLDCTQYHHDSTNNPGTRNAYIPFSQDCIKRRSSYGNIITASPCVSDPFEAPVSGVSVCPHANNFTPWDSIKPIVGPNINCPTPILGLSPNRSQVIDKLNHMFPVISGTHSEVGLMWGLRALSPKWSGFWKNPAATATGDYNVDTHKKMMILLTDGQNASPYHYEGYWGCRQTGDRGGHTDPTSDTPGGRGAGPCWKSEKVDFSTKKLNELTLNMCKYIRNDILGGTAGGPDIELYVIAYDLSDKAAVKMLKDCANDDAHFFEADSATINDTFQAIASSALRLVR